MDSETDFAPSLTGKTETERKHLLEELLLEFTRRKRRVYVVEKRFYWHQRWIDRALRLVTMGGMTTYLTDYVTTLGHTIYVPEGFGERDPGRAWEVLQHELVHVRQFERYTLLGMSLFYLLFPFPLGLAYGRALLEWEAYAVTLRCVAHIEGIEAAKDPALHAMIVRRFTGPDYGWMWPFPSMVLRWIHQEVAAIEARMRA